MKTVGVISDTHGRLSLDVVAALFEVDHIIHAGDICGPDIIRELSALAPTTAVLGNNDYNEYGSDVQRFASPVIEGVRFLVAHYPRQVRIGFNGCDALSAGDPIPDVCIHGHTHIPVLEQGAEARPAQYFLCPGSVSLPRGGFPASLAYVQVEEGKVLGVSIVSLAGKVLMSTEGGIR